ncbi:MAG: lysophospholipase [Geminicoccaceae bacterium]|nr:lysophospholipase [Geminicoccaceae bacterium]MCX7628949.1 lysophospholipase [Geminicoccaceae bacterium]MDW8124332.1 alpha/beta fold hydrolase [Geminicoccaceae bacterium]MDW8340375.1 alpha/beta fold hydrolase [Geminicoccaceae bacterium]
MVQFVLAGLAGYAAVVAALYLLQDELVFPRGAAKGAIYGPPRGAQRLELATPEGETLVGWLVPARGESEGVVLGFGGNAWNADDLATFLAPRVGCHDLVVFHYRGYGASSGRPSERALYADALLVYDRVKERLPNRPVYAIGLSLGAAVVAFLASRRPLDGIVLVTPFDSVEAMARERLPWVPVRLLLRHPFRAADHLRGVDVPAAVILAERDEVVSPERSAALVAALARPLFVAMIPGATHNRIYDEEAFDRALAEALSAFARIASDPAPGKGPAAPDGR